MLLGTVHLKQVLCIQNLEMDNSVQSGWDYACAWRAYGLLDKETVAEIASPSATILASVNF